MQAERLSSEGQIDGAIRMFEYASQNFLLSTKFTADEKTIHDLKLLASAASTKSEELQQRKSFLRKNTPPKPTQPIQIPQPTQNAQFTSSTPSSFNSNLSTSPGGLSTVVSGSRQFFVGEDKMSDSLGSDEILRLYMPNLRKPTDSIATINVNDSKMQISSSPGTIIREQDYLAAHPSQFESPTQNATNSPQSNGIGTEFIWNWMERILDLLPKTTGELFERFNGTSTNSDNANTATNNQNVNRRNESDLLQSFYMVSENRKMR